MPETSSTGRSSRSGSSRSKRSGPKFIPNLTQLQEATLNLPDAQDWDDDSYSCNITVSGKQKLIKFTRKQITRGSSKTYRWIYEGKVLIRNRDIPTED